MDEKSNLKDELVEEFKQEPEILDMTPLESIKSLVRQALGYDELSPIDLTKHISVALRSSSGQNAIAERGSDSNILSFFGSGEYPASSLKLSIVPVQEGTGDPAPDNVRPITGWTEANVYHYGKNFCDPSKWVPGSVGNDPSQGGFVLVPSANAYRNTGIKLPAGTYTFSSAAVSHAAVLYIYKTTGEVVQSKTVWTRTAFPITKTIAEDELVAVVVRKTDVADADTANIKLQIERGSSASSFEAYQGDTISTTFPTPPSTVYGGTLDIITGALSVTYVSETFTGTDIVSADSDFSADRKYAIIKRASESKANGYRVSNSYKALLSTDIDATGFLFVSNTNLGVRIFDPRFTDLETAQSILTETPFQLVYELAEPGTYELDPEELSTLIGENNIWADCGPVESITY